MNDGITTRLAQQLAGLRHEAPASLEAATLAAVGLRDSYAIVAGPTCDLFVAWSRRGVTSVVPATIEEDTFVTEYSYRNGGKPIRVTKPPDRLSRQLTKTLETGKLGNLPIDLSSLTPFQRAVLTKTAEVPAGELRPYGWVAREIGKPGAVRAVGSALNKNPVPVVIPCHRVGRSDGSVGEYAYGPDMKRALLLHEGLDPDELEARAARGVRLTGSDTTNIFCHPTCRHAKRTSPEHNVDFRSERAARAAGFRPCKVCRPAAA